MRTNYARGTYLETSPDGYSTYTRGRAICSDGRVRQLKRIAPYADTFFSVPAAVTVQGKTVSGYVTVQTVQGFSTPSDDDPAAVKFNAYTYRKNHNLLPAGMFREEDETE